MSFGFEENKFYIDVKPIGREVYTPIEEFKLRARSLANKHENIWLSFSGGSDSQITMLAFKEQNIPFKCAFMYLPKYNENEFAQVKALTKKHNLDLFVVPLDPYVLKDEILSKSKELDIPPNQILHSIFLGKLPKDITFIQCFNGPDFYVKDNTPYVLETANSVEYARLRAMQTLYNDRTVVGFEKDEAVQCSVLKDSTVQGILKAWNYYNIEGLSYLGEEPISVINYWDLFIKPAFIGKHWGDKVTYYPKYQGIEKVDFIIDGMEHKYRENQIFFDVYKLIDLIESDNPTKRFYQRS